MTKQETLIAMSSNEIYKFPLFTPRDAAIMQISCGYTRRCYHHAKEMDYPVNKLSTC